MAFSFITVNRCHCGSLTSKALFFFGRNNIESVFLRLYNIRLKKNQVKEGRLADSVSGTCDF